VTLFLDAKAFASAIGADMGEIMVLVVAPDGRILGKAAGKPGAAAETAIEGALSSAFGTAR
jgi:hypothetical protein